MMSRTEFIRVVTKNEEECFLLTTLKDEGKEGLDLSVCCGSDVWSGQVTADDLDDLGTKLKMDFHSYVQQTVEALTCTRDSSETFQYQLKRRKDSVDFVWKKHIPTEDITFQLGTTTLKKREDTPRYLALMFNHCITHMVELQERIRSLETDNERLSQERINALKRLDKCVVAKEELESDLYSKFSAVLNSKKKKIRDLKQQLESGEPIVKDPKPSTSGKRSRTPPASADSDHGSGNHDSDSGQNTDEEVATSKKRRRMKVTASQVKSSAADDSLVLGGDEEEEPAPTARPKRQRGRQKKQTPSKPVLPRVGSNESETGSARKPSLRKSGSNTSSNKSSDSVDPEDLFGGL